MNEQQFRAALDACRDERRDPLDDPALCAWLAEHPEQLEGFARQQQRLMALCAVAAPARTRRLNRVAVALAATLALAAALAFALRPAPPLGRVLRAEIEVLPRSADLAATWQERQVLLDGAHGRIELFTRHTIHR